MLVPLSDLLTAGDRRQPIAWHRGRYIRFEEFRAAVGGWARRFNAEPFQAYALYTDDAYPFAVRLFALLHAGKEVWIAGNNRPGTATLLQQTGCRLTGDWHSFEASDVAGEPVGDAGFISAGLNPDRARLVIFTSGSTGEAKPVIKRLGQLQAEIDTLERRWGEQLSSAEARATVSHQHIYGLLFRVLWPLSAGRSFHSRMAISPEELLQQSLNAYWVASPAHLKRLDRNSPWDGLARLAAIFSSGGPLPPSAAQRILANGNRAAIEVYGSTETGGIAWRQQPDPAWTLFEGMKLIPDDLGMTLHSPYLPNGESLRLDDRIRLEACGRFSLQGRQDRIVKIEEKRLSLNELEQRLTDTPWIEEAIALVIAKSRDIVAAAVVLNAEGREYQKTKGRKALIRQLREALYRWFDAVVLPRKWLFLAHSPVTAQGKIDTRLLTQLLGADSDQFPHLQSIRLEADYAELQIKVPDDLLYFRDHFKDHPLLPGVVQIGWVEHFGKMLFPIVTAFSQLEAIKFIKVIRPGCELKLKLRWKSASGKLCFSFASQQQTYSSGRLVYAGKDRENQCDPG
jgi:acyl-coenzyme A synthetase/AMP-(fatty) acid ligase/3-hydroxymyristoyl/3-hydroxydecanoyl-(acyl carrier protein) dehydratase